MGGRDALRHYRVELEGEAYELQRGGGSTDATARSRLRQALRAGHPSVVAALTAMMGSFARADFALWSGSITVRQVTRPAVTVDLEVPSVPLADLAALARQPARVPETPMRPAAVGPTRP